jgi:hypothetical protein
MAVSTSPVPALPTVPALCSAALARKRIRAHRCFSSTDVVSVHSQRVVNHCRSSGLNHNAIRLAATSWAGSVGSGAFGMTAMLATIVIWHCRTHASVRQGRGFASDRRPCTSNCSQDGACGTGPCAVPTCAEQSHIAIRADVDPTDLRVDTRVLDGMTGRLFGSTSAVDFGPRQSHAHAEPKIQTYLHHAYCHARAQWCEARCQTSAWYTR